MTTALVAAGVFVFLILLMPWTRKPLWAGLTHLVEHLIEHFLEDHEGVSKGLLAAVAVVSWVIFLGLLGYVSVTVARFIVRLVSLPLAN